MTTAEILALPAGDELSALIAEKLMGCRPVKLSSGFFQCGCEPLPGRPWGTWPHGEMAPDGPNSDLIRAYSEDIAIAWEVMEKLRGRGGKPVVGWNGKAWDSCANINTAHGFEDDWHSAETPSLAICRAALASVLP